MYISKKDQGALFQSFLQGGDLQRLNVYEERLFKMLAEEKLTAKEIAIRIYNDPSQSRLDEHAHQIEIRITRLTRRIQQVYRPVVKVDKEAAKLALIEEIKLAGKPLADIEVAGLFWGTAGQSLKDAGVENFDDVVRIGFRRLFRSPGLGLITLNEVERLLFLFGGNWKD